jgi:hypothetical protein
MAHLADEYSAAEGSRREEFGAQSLYNPESQFLEVTGHDFFKNPVPRTAALVVFSGKEVVR